MIKLSSSMGKPVFATVFLAFRLRAFDEIAARYIVGKENTHYYS